MLSPSLAVFSPYTGDAVPPIMKYLPGLHFPVGMPSPSVAVFSPHTRDVVPPPPPGHHVVLTWATFPCWHAEPVCRLLQFSPHIQGMQSPPLPKPSCSTYLGYNSLLACWARLWRSILPRGRVYNPLRPGPSLGCSRSGLGTGTA